MKITRSVFTLSIVYLITAADSALASTGAQGFEYESALETLAESLTGPFAFYTAIVAMVASAAAVIFGGELTGWIKMMLGLVFIASCIVFAKNFFSILFGSQGALIF